MVGETLPRGSSDPPTSCTDGQTLGTPQRLQRLLPFARDRALYAFWSSQFLLPFNFPWGQLKVPGEVAKEDQADSSLHWTGGGGGQMTHSRCHMSSHSPFPIWMKPSRMMRARASSLAAAKASCTRVAAFTL